MMFTDPKIRAIEGRSYIEYYFDGKRQREYNGNKLSLRIFPNRSKIPLDKIKYLKQLRLEFKKALKKGWSPYKLNNESVKPLTLESKIKAILNSKLSSSYSKTYKRDLKSVSEKLLRFLTSSEKAESVKAVDNDRIEEFLNKFNSSNRHYMNKRQMLNIFLPGTILKTQRKKYVEQLHEIYTKEQLLPILVFLKENYPKLHLAALLTYGCLLRPHEETRLLQKRHIRGDKIYLSGEENKSRRVRVVYIPDYVYEVLSPYLQACQDPDSYLFTGTDQPLNQDYFKTQWSRAKRKLIKLNLIQSRQTLYSFRHTAAINIYNKSKDVHIVQQLLGHSDMLVTLKYLRGLGELNLWQYKEYMPTL